MKTKEQLYEEARLLVAQANAILEDDARKSKDDMAEADALLDKAAALKKSADQAAELEVKKEPMRLPFDTAPDAKSEDKSDPAVKMFFVQKYGDQPEAVKAILRDLHGDDYEDLYWRKKQLFGQYLRYGDVAMDAEQRGLLRRMVMTPDVIKGALMAGLNVSAMKSTMVEAQDALGGYIVLPDFQANIVGRLPGMTVMRGRARIVTTSSDRVQLPKATGGGDQYSTALRAYWVDETPTAGTAETNLTWGMEEIPVGTQMSEVPISRNLLEDAFFNLEDYLAEKFAEAAAIDEDNQFLVGDGAGKPQGILPGSANGLSITEVVTGSNSTLTADGLIDLTYGIGAQYRQNAAWIAEKATCKVVRKLKTGDGEYLWERNQQAGQPERLLGYPVLEQEGMPTIALNAYPIIFGDPKGYTIADRIGMRVERFLDSATARQNLVYFVMTRRLGGQCTETWRFAVQKVAAS